MPLLTLAPLDFDTTFGASNAVTKLLQRLPDLGEQFGLHLPNNAHYAVYLVDGIKGEAAPGRCCLCGNVVGNWSSGTFIDDLCRRCGETPPYDSRNPRQLAQFYTQNTVRTSIEFRFTGQMKRYRGSVLQPQSVFSCRFVALKIDGRIQVARTCKALDGRRYGDDSATFYDIASGQPFYGIDIGLPAIGMTYEHAEALYHNQPHW